MSESLRPTRMDRASFVATFGHVFEHSQTYDEPAVRCDPDLMAALEAAVDRAGVRPYRLPSGAGHDAMALATLCPIAMLFVRCKGGISHNPAESITSRDADLAVRVLLGFLRNLRPAGS